MHSRATRISFSLLISFALALTLCVCFSFTTAHADEDDVQALNLAQPTNGTWKKSSAGWKYLTDDGAITGFAKIGDKTYYLDTDTAIMKTGWLKQGDTWYYFNKSGAMKTGWLKTGGKWYYLNPSDGKMLTGKQTLGNATYFLTSSGAMKTSWNKEDGTWYHYKNSGAMTTGWLKSKGKWYYLDPSDGAMKTGKYKVGSSFYISNASGAMHANKWVQLSEGWYYATKSGALKAGWLKSGGKWYWLQADKDCLMIADTKATINGALYSFTSSGAMRANCQVKLDDGACGYAASSGAITKIGIFNGENVILQDANGNPLTGWQKLAGKWFYANSNGVMQTGWLKDGSKWYWLDKNSGAMATNAWVDGGKYYVGANGVWMQANIIQDIRSSLSHGTKSAKHQKYIVLHDTEGGGTPQNVVNWWASNGKLIAAHFVIGKDGTIVQCVPMDKIAHHAGWGTRGHNAKFGVTDESRDDKRGTTRNSWSNDYGMNSYSIGIELVHNGSTGEGYPKAQLEALDKLIAYIDSYYGFQSTIIDHKMWRVGNSDTSKEFARYLANYRDHRSYK